MNEQLMFEDAEQSYKEMLDLLNEASDDCFFFFDFRTQNFSFSNQIKETVGLFKEYKTFCSLREWKRVVYPQDLSMLMEELEELAAGRHRVHNIEYRIITRKGNVMWINSRGKTRLDKNGTPLGLFGQISESVWMDKADQFTGTFNMESLKEELEKLLADQQNGYLLLVGVDDLKTINIKRGWEFGNGILKSVVQCLESVAAGNRIYRVNGDCFGVNLVDVDRNQVEAIFLQLQKYLQGQCTLSGGCVPLRQYTVPDAGTLFQYVENSLESAKAQGKNMLCFFSAKDYEKDLAVLELKEDLYHSVRTGYEGFSLLYQPQIDSRTLELFGAEALLRFNSPRRGMVSPAEFIPILEETGLIIPVGIWVLKNALKQCGEWKKQIPNFHMSVNVSCCQMRKNNIAEDVITCVQQSGVSPDSLTLEITESMSLLSLIHINKTLSAWKKAGIRISVDDFGTGYSSLARLKELKVDEIKIDRCFVKEIQNSVYNHRLISNMIELADGQNIDVCCEGVETLEELAVLRDLRPTLLQGYLFAKPCTPEQFETLYLNENAPEYLERVRREKGYLSEQTVSEKFSEIQWSEEEVAQIILSEESDIFYISDLETYELYYLNSAGKKAMDIKDYQGKKCYRVLQGRNEPCDFCTNHLLNEHQFYTWERVNPYSGHRYQLRDKLISYHGKKFRLEIARDLTKKENISTEIRERLKFAEKVIDYTKILSNTMDYKQAVQNMLAALGEFYQADRAYLFEPSLRDGYWDNTFEWCAENVVPQYEHLQDVEPSTVAQWLDIFHKDLSVVIYNLDVLRKTDPAMWEALSTQDISRLIATPIRDGDKIIAFVGVDNPRYSISDDSQIRVLSNFLLNRIRQERNELHLRSLLKANYHSTLDILGVGLWMVRIDLRHKRKELIIDDTLKRTLGLTTMPNLEECYCYWYDRINNGYYHYVNESIKHMAKSWGIVQLEYTWVHPQKGEVMVRCIGTRVPDEKGMLCLKGYHRIISDIDQPKIVSDIGSKIVFEYNEIHHTAFFHIGREMLMGANTKEVNFPDCWIEQEIVHPHFAMEFRETFSKLRTKEQFQELELPLKTTSGAYEWFKVDLQHAGTEEEDLDTVIVMMKPFGAYRLLEIEHRRIRRFYRAILSETIAFAEVDLESGHLKSIGGLWKGYEQAFYNEPNNFLSFMVEQFSKYLSEEDLSKIQSYFTPDGWRSMLEKGESCQRFYYRRMINRHFRWVELVFHLFREDITRNVYALIYLKDIHNQKEQEILQEEAATQDPLTKVLNRSAFEQKVSDYVSGHTGSTCGALILLDVDDFKNINDQKGHLVGDKALQRFTEVLRSTFRETDLIGRLGGDEFLVFVKGVQCREDLDVRIRQLLRNLREDEDIPMSSSVGITFVFKDGFHYKDCLRQADTALYETKKRGKNGFTYYKDERGYLPEN